jgi:hypothetical protein
MLVVSALRQLPAPVCTKLRSKAPGRSHQCASQLRWETRSRHRTHTEASTKLITAHQAHHCNDHPRSQSRFFFLLPKHREFHDLVKTRETQRREPRAHSRSSSGRAQPNQPVGHARRARRHLAGARVVRRARRRGGKCTHSRGAAQFRSNPEPRALRVLETNAPRIYLDTL